MRTVTCEGIEVSGEVGDPDPVQAAQDALLKGPADEVLIFEHSDRKTHWYEEGLLERARADYERGDYRWVAEVVNHVVFADPDDADARALQADALCYGRSHSIARRTVSTGSAITSSGATAFPYVRPVRSAIVDIGRDTWSLALTNYRSTANTGQFAILPH